MVLAEITLFIIGLAMLLVFANLVVNSAVKLAYLLKISPLIIGATIVGIGTSLPELAVSIFGSLRRSSDLVAGNIIGSNIANIGLVLGVSFLVGRIRIGTTKTQVLAVIHLFTTLVFLALLVYGLLLFPVGLIFLFGTAGILFWQVRAGRRGARAEDKVLFERDSLIEAGSGSNLRPLVIGLIGTFLGGKILVDSSLNIARLLGVAPSLIGLTVIALGTSAPELITNFFGVIKGEEKLVIGGILGTNIINTLLIGGFSSFFAPLYFTNMIGITALLGGTFLLSLLVFLYKGRNVPRLWGAVLLAGYCFYLLSLVRRFFV